MLKFFIISVTVIAAPLAADSITWVAESPNNNIETPANWSPNTVPGGGDDVIFDSSLSNVDTGPTEQSNDFSVRTFQFLKDASPFTISINNHSLNFNGVGIAGLQTNATIMGINRDNLALLGTQLSFNSSASASSGSAIINMSNSATNSGIASAAGNNFSVATGQYFVLPSFVLQSGSQLILTNSGVDSSNGSGNNKTAFLNSYQAQITDTYSAGDNVTISLSNSGNYSGSNSSSGNNVGAINGFQFSIDGEFEAGDNLSFTIANSGTNSSTGSGNNGVGALTSAQANFNDNFIIGDNGTILISNQGVNSSTGTSPDFTGYVVDQQLYVNGQFNAGNDLSMTVSNIGNDTSEGGGGALTAVINTLTDTTGSQVVFNDACNLGNHATISTQNSGTCSGSKTVEETIVSGMNLDQMLFRGDFQTGNFLNLSVSNAGMDSSQGVGANIIGSLFNSQLHLVSSSTLGDNVTISVSNSGNFSGSNSSEFNYVGSVDNKQFHSSGDFQSGNFFLLNVENVGVHSSSGVGGNLVGVAGRGQAEFVGSCTLGDKASFVISNNGTNSSTSTLNSVGYSGGAQLKVRGDFIAGKGLNISITNASTNTGDLDNDVGTVDGSQALFEQAFTVGNGSLLSVSNSGFVTGSQILLNQGFNITSGKATIQAINHGTVAGTGILIEGDNAGGNANIVLENATLNIDTTTSTFTIGELNGDSTSIVQSNPSLIIKTDASTHGDFSGVIQDFPSTSSTLIKQGPGTQMLSGINTYTGLTTIQEGALSVTGSLAGDVAVSSGGMLKGKGVIAGLVTIENGGMLSPGNSIGTITLGSLALNSASITAIEIDPISSSRINVVGNATVDGTLQINPDPGAYPREGSQLILSSGTLNGAFSSITQSPGFTFSLAYLANDIYLNYIFAIPTQGLKENSLKVANYLNAYAPPSTAFTSLAVLSGDPLNHALKSISPSRNAFSTYIAQQTAFSLSSIVMGHMDAVRSEVLSCENCCSCSNTFSGWISGFGEFIHQNAEDQNPSFDALSEGVIGGLDLCFDNRGFMGTALGYAHSHFSEDHNFGHGDISYYFASIYSNAFVGDFYFSPAIWGIFNETENTRNVFFPTFSEKAKADITAWQLLPHLEVGYENQFCWGNMTPFSALDIVFTFQRGYHEHGAAPFNAKVRAHQSSMVRSETGLKFCEQWECAWGTFFLREKASYVFQKPFGTGRVRAALTDISTPFSVNAVNQPLNLGVIEIDMALAFGQQMPVSIDLGYEGEFGSNYSSNQLMLTISKDF